MRSRAAIARHMVGWRAIGGPYGTTPDSAGESVRATGPALLQYKGHGATPRQRSPCSSQSAARLASGVEVPSTATCRAATDLAQTQRPPTIGSDPVGAQVHVAAIW